jgi:hypothetical protein
MSFAAVTATDPITPIYRLSRDAMAAIRQHGGGITVTEARYLVDTYYRLQEQRIRANNQLKALARDATASDRVAEPHEALAWTMDQFATLEKSLEKILAIYVASHPMSWFFDQTLGIGPILAAGLLAHIDIHRAVTAGHIYRYAGLDPTQTWERGQKRPWNADLKKLCWKIGDSFVKTSGRPHGYYGRVYRERKAYEWDRNLAGTMAADAAAYLTKMKFRADTDAYAWYSGACDPALARAALAAGKAPTAATCAATDPAAGQPMLPPGQIDMRARRWAVKLFLSHLQHRWWEQATGTSPPHPYAIAILGHAHYLPPPQTPPAAAAAVVPV